MIGRPFDSERDERDFMKCAADSIFARPLIGAVLGGGAGALADAIRPADDDENRKKRRIASILGGSLLGSIVGIGANQVKEVAPWFDSFDAADKKRVFDPSWSSVIGGSMVAAPAGLFAYSKVKALPAPVKAMLKSKYLAAKLAVPAVIGSGIVARNQFKKQAYLLERKQRRRRVEGLTKEMLDAIYRGTRSKLVDEAKRSSRGSRIPTWQGWRDPITNDLRFPVSFGSKPRNDLNAALSPAQANMISLLTTGKKFRDHRDVARALRIGDSNLEFIGDPTRFDLGRSELTDKGWDDLKYAWKTVFGHEMNDHELGLVKDRLSSLFGTDTIEGGKPFRFERFGVRPI